MRLKVTLARAGTSPAVDVLVTVDTTVTVGEVARAIATRDPLRDDWALTGRLSLALDDAGPVLSPETTVADSGLVSGQAVRVVDATAARPAPAAREAAATLVVLWGPDAGREFPLRAGANQIGRSRSNDVVLKDPLVSKIHARVNVTDVVEIVDLGSANGVAVGGDVVARTVLRPDDVVELGDTTLRIVQHGRPAPVRTEGAVDFNRSPAIDPVQAGVSLRAPEVPRRNARPRFPLIPMIAPVLMGCVMFAITQNAVTVLFVALSPIMMLGNVIESRVFAKRDLEKATAAFREALANLRRDLATAATEEAAGRRREHPATGELVDAALHRAPQLWFRRPDQRGYLEVRLGLATLPSRNEVEQSMASDGVPELGAELTAIVDEFATVPSVPAVAALRECGSVGVAGARGCALPVARALVGQLVTAHSPAEVMLAAIGSSATAHDWDWLKWLPHTSSDHTPLAVDHLVASPGGIARLVAAIEDVIDQRTADRPGAADVDALPAIVVLVEGDAPIERSRLVELAERGPAAGVHTIWVAPAVAQLPAACRVFVDADPARAGLGDLGYVEDGERVRDVTLEQLDGPAALRFAKSLAPVVDAGARVDDASDLPRTMSLVSLMDTELLHSADSVVDRWRTSGSVAGGARRAREHSLRATVGITAGQSLVLDLREHGPHALVGGTTGSGKSEFLQAWTLALALDHSPSRVTFLFVDYKGGAAFADCVHLPHSVGLVTDLTPHLVRRALTSLNAELRHREQLLQVKKAKDLLELERRGDPDTPPSLVIVVDEFAALVKEVPEFVDGVVNVAQRGRSLGLHLVLATQRPAGVIKDNLRANTNLRVALRMADVVDSDDVVGSAVAASFDPGTPGRAIAKLGAGRLTPFQSAYVGGWTSDTPPPPVITVDELAFGAGSRWEERDEEGHQPAPSGPNDLQRLVAGITAAHEQLGLPAPRRPWLEPLAEVYDLARSPQSRTDAELIFAIADDPAHQRQVPVAFVPDRDGNMAVYGTGGSGKSALLRTVAITAGLGLRGGPCHVYGLDFGTRGLQMLEALPHVGAIVTGDDHERIQRTLRTLRETIDERAARYARLNAGSIEDYRKSTGRNDEPRILLLVDNVGAFRQAYEVGDRARWFDVFQTIAADGRQVGVHVVVTADRAGAVSSALASVIQRHVVLRMATDQDLAMLGAPLDGFAGSSPPGRGFIGGDEVQVLVLGGSGNTSRQAAAIRRLATELEGSGTARVAPAIGRLTERVRLGELPVEAEGLPVLGIADDTLAAAGFAPEDVLLVVGPPLSGRTSTLAAIALSLHRWRPGRLVYLGPGRSPLRASAPFTEVAVGPDDVAEAARALVEKLGAGATDAPVGIVVEDVSSFINSSAEMALLDLIKAARAAGVFLATDAETSSLASWPLQLAVKAARHGIALQPDQLDGDTVFKTTFPRLARAEFPPGRGLYVRGGRIRRVQCALPEVEPS